jgi:hypothetical protein
MMRHEVLRAVDQPERLRNARHQLGAGPGIARGEKGDIMPHADQFFGQEVHDPFGSTV